MGTSIQSRVRRGVPTGGQFAPTNRPEANGSQLSDELVLAAATKCGERYARRYGVEAADVIGETALRFYERRSRRPESAPVLNDSGYVNTLARSIALEAIGADRSYVRQAWRKYQEICDAQMQELGRELTTRESDAIASSVIAAQEPRRRAPEGFHRQRKTTSLDSPGHEMSGGRTLAEDIADIEVPERSDAEKGRRLGPSGELAEQLIASGDSAGARRLAWDAIAELAGAPKTVKSLVTERQATALRHAVRSEGGAGAIAKLYRRGLAEESASEHLFAPFGAISSDERDAVVEVLVGREHLADDLWDLALRASTTQRGTNV